MNSLLLLKLSLLKTSPYQQRLRLVKSSTYQQRLRLSLLKSSPYQQRLRLILLKWNLLRYSLVRLQQRLM